MSCFFLLIPTLSDLPKITTSKKPEQHNPSMTLGTCSRTATGLGGSEEASETPLSQRQNIFLLMPKYISHAARGAISELTQRMTHSRMSFLLLSTLIRRWFPFGTQLNKATRVRQPVTDQRFFSHPAAVEKQPEAWRRGPREARRPWVWASFSVIVPITGCSKIVILHGIRRNMA